MRKPLERLLQQQLSRVKHFLLKLSCLPAEVGSNAGGHSHLRAKQTRPLRRVLSCWVL
jgi:hypothetical protein